MTSTSHLNSFPFGTSQLRSNFISELSPYGPNALTELKDVKMEQEPANSPAKEKQPDIPVKNGYLDDIFSISKARQHPFVLMEESTLRWMGLRVSLKKVNITSPSPGCMTLTNSGSRLAD